MYIPGYCGTRYNAGEIRALALENAKEVYTNQPNVLNSTSEVSLSRQEILVRIIQGLLVTDFEWTGLVEQCLSSQKCFSPVALRPHILVCAQ